MFAGPKEITQIKTLMRSMLEYFWSRQSRASMRILNSKGSLAHTLAFQMALLSFQGLRARGPFLFEALEESISDTIYSRQHYSIRCYLRLYIHSWCHFLILLQKAHQLLMLSTVDSAEDIYCRYNTHLRCYLLQQTCTPTSNVIYCW